MAHVETWQPNLGPNRTSSWRPSGTPVPTQDVSCDPLLGAVEADVELEFIPPICLECPYALLLGVPDWCDALVAEEGWNSA